MAEMAAPNVPFDKTKMISDEDMVSNTSRQDLLKTENSMEDKFQSSSLDCERDQDKRMMPSDSGEKAGAGGSAVQVDKAAADLNVADDSCGTLNGERSVEIVIGGDGEGSPMSFSVIFTKITNTDSDLSRLFRDDEKGKTKSAVSRQGKKMKQCSIPDDEGSMKKDDTTMRCKETTTKETNGDLSVSVDGDEEVDPNNRQSTIECRDAPDGKSNDGQRRDEDIPPRKCPVCDKVFGSSDDLKSHVTFYSKEESSIVKNGVFYRVKGDKTNGACACLMCGKQFGQRVLLRLHMRRVHRGQKECHVCHKVFSKISSLECHLRVHSGEKPFKCTMCERAYTNKRELKDHIIIEHGGETPYSCFVCNKTFRSHSSMQRHVAVCDKVFGRSEDVKIQVTYDSSSKDGGNHDNHNNNKRKRKKKSSSSSAAFYDYSNNTVARLKTTSDFKIFNERGEMINTTCLVCGKGLETRGLLQMHMRRIHPGKKECLVCGKAFSKTFCLERHMMVHSGERPHACGVCGKAYVNKRELTDHLRICHEGESPYACSVCGQCLASSTALARHLAAQHSIRRHKR